MNLSIILPVYNGEKTIYRALFSIANQKNIDFDFEIIIINDASTDNTEKIINAFFKEFPSLNYSLIKNDHNIGVSESRNIGIAKASSDIIAFLDADDEWDQFKVFHQYQTMKSKDIDFSFTDFRIFNSFGFVCLNKDYWGYEWLQTDFLFKNPISFIILNNFIGLSTVMCKKDIFKEEEFKSGNYSEDWRLWLRIALKHEFLYINQPLTNYYMINESITRTKRIKYDLINIISPYKNQCSKLVYKEAEANALFFIGESALFAGNKKEAIKYFSKSLLLSPSPLTFRYLLSSINPF